MKEVEELFEKQQKLQKEGNLSGVVMLAGKTLLWEELKQNVHFTQLVLEYELEEAVKLQNIQERKEKLRGKGEKQIDHL